MEQESLIATSTAESGERFAGAKLRGPFGITTTLATEWGWVVGRLTISGIVGIGGVFYLLDHPVYPIVLGLLGVALLYNAAIIFLLLVEKLGWALLLGLAMDNGLLFFGWWAGMSTATPTDPATDFYLAIFIILSFGIIRLGWRLGALFAVTWLLWMIWTSLYYLGPDSYAVDQLPLRVLFLALHSGMTIYLVERWDVDHRRVEAFARTTERQKQDLEQRIREVGGLNRLFQQIMTEERRQ